MGVEGDLKGRGGCRGRMCRCAEDRGVMAGAVGEGVEGGNPEGGV